MFFMCKNLHTINLPEGVTKIESFTFFGCDSLETVIIPDSCEELGPTCFDSIKQLKNVFINKATSNLRIINHGAFAGCPALESIIIPDKITCINENTFSCSGIKNIYLNNVENISWHGFYNCNNLSMIYGPNVIKIESSSIDENFITKQNFPKLKKRAY